MVKREVTLAGGEVAEPLDGEHIIIQSKNGYRFGSDAIALAKFAARHVRAGQRVFELCSGCGIVGIQLALYTGCEVDGAEIDRELFDMSVRSCEANGLGSVRFTNADIRTLDAKKSGYDAVVCNPPFFKADSKPAAIAPAANSELTVTLGDVADRAAELLKPGGSLYLVHTSTRLDEVIITCAERGLTAKELMPLSGGKTFLFRAVRGGKRGMKLITGEL